MKQSPFVLFVRAALAKPFSRAAYYRLLARGWRAHRAWHERQAAYWRGEVARREGLVLGTLASYQVECDRREAARHHEGAWRATVCAYECDSALLELVIAGCRVGGACAGD